MLELSGKLETLICRHAATLRCAAVIHVTGEVSNRVGDFTAFEQAGLASAVLGPYGDPASSFQMAAQYEGDRRMLPQGMGQGDFFALLDKPQTDFVVVVFGIKSGDVREQFKHRNEIATTILEIFEPAEDESLP